MALLYWPPTASRGEPPL